MGKEAAYASPECPSQDQTLHRVDSSHAVELLPILGSEALWLDRLPWTQGWWDLNFNGRVNESSLDSSGQEGQRAERKFHRTSYTASTESKDVGDRRVNEQERLCWAM